MRHVLLVSFLLFALATSQASCQASSIAVLRSPLGTTRPLADLEAVLDLPGPWTAETVASAQWQVDLGGLLDLGDPRAQAAGLEDRLEPIEVYFHALQHPTRGLYLVDSGVEMAERDHPETARVQGLVRRFMHADLLRVTMPLGLWLRSQPHQPAGLFLTHLHMDHIWGMPDLGPLPIYVGPGESTARSFEHLFVQGPTDDLLRGHASVREWSAVPEGAAPLAQVIDVFGDGTLWALPTPGHTAGSMAYLARTTSGAVLFVGDTCHTAWGWRHGVPPGSFTADRAQNQRSLDALRALAERHPHMQIRLGHQRLESLPR